MFTFFFCLFTGTFFRVTGGKLSCRQSSICMFYANKHGLDLKASKVKGKKRRTEGRRREFDGQWHLCADTLAIETLEACCIIHKAFTPTLLHILQRREEEQEQVPMGKPFYAKKATKISTLLSFSRFSPFWVDFGLILG